MDSFERYQGEDTHISLDKNVPATGSSDHLETVLAKSKLRLSLKRNREIEINEHKLDNVKKYSKTVGQEKQARVSAPIVQQRLEETPEEKKARKLALKLARNEKRAAIQADASVCDTSKRVESINIGNGESTELKKNTYTHDSSVDSVNNKGEILEQSIVISNTDYLNPSIRYQLFSTELNGGDKLGMIRVAYRRSADEVEEDLEAADIIAPSTHKIVLREAVEKWNLDKKLEDRLYLCGIVDFFPIQTAVIPVLLGQNERECIRKRDICVAAPTGSGMTSFRVLFAIYDIISLE